jgi:flagellar biosynthetic protein FliP
VTGTGVLGAIGALVVTLGALALAAHLLRRLQGLSVPGGRALPMRVLQRVSLGPRHGILLLQIADRVLVCSISDGGTRLLTELTDAAREEALRPAGNAGGRPPLFGLRLPGIGRTLAMLALLALPEAAFAQGAPAAGSAARAPAVARPAPAPGAAAATAGAEPSRLAAATPAPARAGAGAPGPVVHGPLPPRVEVRLGEGSGALQLEGAVGVVVFLGLLTLLPALFLLMTSFTRILIVLHFLRTALGTQTTPPGQLLVAIAVLLTGVVMNPVLQQAHRIALQPYFDGRISQVEAYSRGIVPFRQFMLANTREKDLGLFTGLSGLREAPSLDELPTVTIVSAFVTSELRTAFQMGFLIFLPFVVVDVIVASVLMSLGMFMLPPAMISLPFKLLLFVLADGWALVVQNLAGSFGGTP